MDILSLERIWYHTPIVESDNLSRYCPIDDFTFMGMESDYISESSKFHLHVFYRMDSENQWYIDMYVWDCMLYPEICRRIIIQNGFILAEEDESLFIEYTRRLESEGMYDKGKFDLIRNKDKPEHAFVTAEICNRKLQQVYGCRNGLPERAVYEFLEVYCRKHCIDYDPEKLIWDSIEELDESEYETELEEYLEVYRKKQYMIPAEFEEKCMPCIQLTFMDVFPEIFRNE